MKKEKSPSSGTRKLDNSKYIERRKFRGRFDLPLSVSEKDSIIDFLQSRSQDFGVSAPQNLELTQNVITPVRKVMRFRQLQDKIPVFGSYIVAQVGRTGKVQQLDLAVTSRTNVVRPDGDEKLAPQDAVKYASSSLGKYMTRQKISQPETVYYPTRSGLRLAYNVMIPTREPAHDWQIIMDAYTGEILEKRDRILEDDGHGKVFDPNPVVTANNSTYRDPDADATCGFAGTDRAIIDMQQIDGADLKGITFSGNTYKLEGSFVKMRNFSPPDVLPPEESDANNFNYSSGDDSFEAVMIYYHVDTIQRYIQSLGITTAHNSQIEADAHDNSWPNHGAFWSWQDGGLHFGDSGPCMPDRGEDADAILHEYGHAIQNDQVPGWGDLNPITGKYESMAMGEGFGDILACVYFADRGGGFQREVFEDWVFAPYGLRRVDGTKVYPGDWTDPEPDYLHEHDNGEIWSAALWNIYRTIGGDSLNATDRQAARDALLKTVILSHHLLTPDSSMSDGAEAVMETNAELDDYRGKHLMQMLDSFHDRGLLVCSPQADLYIREAEDDLGADQYVGPVFWYSPDLWIRHTEDDITPPPYQEPEFGQDNWFYARVFNGGTATARAFVVTFNVKPWAGTQFVYPDDFVPYISAAVGFNLAPGDSTVVKAKWPSSLVPPKGTHGCVLASVYTPTDVSPIGEHVWEYNNLAQRNFIAEDMMAGDSIVIPFKLGSIYATELGVYRIEIRRPQELTILPAFIMHKDPQVIKRLFNSIEEMEHGKPTQLSTHGIKPRSVLRFLDPTRIEILLSGRKVEPIHINLGKGSTLDIGLKKDESSAELATGLEFSVSGREAKLVPEKLDSTATAPTTAIAFNPGVLTGFPIVLEPRTQIEVFLKIIAPTDAKHGDVFEIHLIQRNGRGAVIGGITVQVNIK